MAQGEALTAPDGAAELLSAGFLDCIRDAVLVYRLDGAVRGYNRRLAQLFSAGPGLDGLDGLSGLLAVLPGKAHPIPPLPDVWQSLLDGEQRSVPFRLPAVAGAKSELELELYARRLIGPEGEVIFVELRDITAAKRAERALQDSKRQLESAVIVRTRDLQQKLALIERQREALLELSTPVIQLWDGILVLPLIGALDRDRSERLTGNLLESITQTRSRQVIIDITGVPSVEESGAAAILRAVRAVQLLGAECSLAGISPGVAQSLIHMESGWSSSLRTFANLQAALLAAIARGTPHSGGVSNVVKRQSSL